MPSTGRRGVRHRVVLSARSALSLIRPFLVFSPFPPHVIPTFLEPRLPGRAASGQGAGPARSRRSEGPALRGPPGLAPRRRRLRCPPAVGGDRRAGTRARDSSSAWVAAPAPAHRSDARAPLPFSVQDVLRLPLSLCLPGTRVRRHVPAQRPASGKARKRAVLPPAPTHPGGRTGPTGRRLESARPTEGDRGSRVARRRARGTKSRRHGRGVTSASCAPGGWAAAARCARAPRQGGQRGGCCYPNSPQFAL